MENADLFQQTDYYQKHLIASTMKADELFASDSETDTIVLFIMNGCMHCEAVQEYLLNHENMRKDSLHFYKVDNAAIQINSSDDPIEHYETDRETMELRGTPTIAVQKAGSDTIDCYMGTSKCLEVIRDLGR